MILTKHEGKCIKEDCKNILMAGTQAKCVGRDKLGRNQYKCMTCYLTQKAKANEAKTR